MDRQLAKQEYRKLQQLIPVWSIIKVEKLINTRLRFAQATATFNKMFNALQVQIVLVKTIVAQYLIPMQITQLL